MVGDRDLPEDAEPTVVSVDGPAGETLLPAGTAAAQAAASAATQKPQAVPVTELILTHPAKVQAQADAAAKAEAEAKATAERERRLARAEADYQRAVMDAAARLAHDDGYADLVHDIIRKKGLNTVEGYDQVDRNFLAERRDYHGELAAQRADLEAERRKLTEGGKQALEDHRFQKLPRWQVPLNEVDRWWQQMKMAGAIYGVREAPPTRVEILADIEAAEQRAKQTPWLTPPEKHILANKDRLLKIADTLEERAFRDLWGAHARFEQIPNSPALRKFAEAATAGEKIDVLLDNPLEFLLVKGGQALPKMAARAAGGFLGGPFGGALAATYMAFGTKHAEAVIKGFADRGIDLQDEAAVRAAVSNRELMREIYHNAFKEAGIAATDQAAWEVLRLRIKSTVLGP